MAARPLSFEDFFDYDVVVLQYQASPAWVTRRSAALQAAGIAVLFEIDDYVHSVRKMARRTRPARTSAREFMRARSSERCASATA